LCWQSLGSVLLVCVASRPRTFAWAIASYLPACLSANPCAHVCVPALPCVLLCCLLCVLCTFLQPCFHSCTFLQSLCTLALSFNHVCTLALPCSPGTTPTSLAPTRTCSSGSSAI
jgi:hypothetical protein